MEHYAKGWRPFHNQIENNTVSFVPLMLSHAHNYKAKFFFVNEHCLKEIHNKETVLAFLFATPEAVTTLISNHGNDWTCIIKVLFYYFTFREKLLSKNLKNIMPN